MVALNRRRGGVEGIYCCEIPDSMNVTQTIYIGVYTTSTSTGDLSDYAYTLLFFQSEIIAMAVLFVSKLDTKMPAKQY